MGNKAKSTNTSTPNTLDKLYQLNADYLKEHLVNEKANALLAGVFNHFPMVRTTMLEVRLHTNWQTDLNICVRHSECHQLAKFARSKNHPRWKLIYHWCRKWMDPNGPLGSIVPNIWLIFDLPQNGKSEVAPWMVFGFAKLPLGEGLDYIMAQQVFAAINFNISTEQDRLLKSMLASMDADNTVPGIGVLESQNLLNRAYSQVDGAGIRIGIGNFRSFSQIERYLDKIKWPGDINFIKEHYQEAVELCTFCDLSIIIGAHIFPELGIECYFDLPQQYPEVNSFLHHLVAKGVCTESKYKALLNWMGEEDILMDHSSFLLSRKIIEVKLMYMLGEGPAAKAYIVFDYE